MTTLLSQVKGLRVPARTSAAVFRGKGYDVRKIGEQLHVSAVLEGSVQRAGSKLRITLQLISTANDSHLWATNYDREMAEIFDVQSEVAQQVVAALKLQLLPDEKSQLTKKPATNLEAYELYLQGRYAQGKLTEAALTSSLHYFEQAIQKQADFALAYAGLADSYRLLTPLYRAPLEVMPKAKEYALKALQLDGTLGEAHTALGMIHFFFDWDWANAEDEFQRALQLSPNNANAHHQYAVFLAAMKRPQEARREIQRAQALDPLSLEVSANTEQCHFPKGSRLGPYKIASSIGAGGMGEVFRARDTRLNRDVAVKVLPKVEGTCTIPQRVRMDADELKEQQAPYSARPAAAIPPDWLVEFEAAARRPLETRFRYAFIRTYKPVLDHAPFRAFETTADYRRWCEEHLPDRLGYGRV